MRESQLIESKELREQFRDRVEVLNKVKALLLMPNTEFATTEQVASYYGVEKKTIQKLVERNREEIVSDGLEVKSYKEITELLNTDNMSALKIPPKGSTIFPPRAILRVGMLLRDSEVAKEVRTQLLNTIEHTTDEAKMIEIDQEKQLYMDIMFAKDEPTRAIAINQLLTYQERYKAKALYVDKAMSSPSGITTTTIAKELGFASARKLNGILSDLNIQYKDNKGQWHLYSKYSEMGYTLPYTYMDDKGITHHSTNWSESGKKFIYDLLTEQGILTTR